ncbi:MBL fold metallo-hydrolase [Ectobacillus ponti]|uniref:MBL fold metallo-hydrolase n=1 Tax=Ectobacillus ponti TaxID=2961894 RepID=A0AA42BQC9_9BACI|nr:MBL fold metallo-hydrolase [Ectobacillus ponti]MCP8969266.1 MBL fold metallo-hydrolase [Ectobacillus ponti]
MQITQISTHIWSVKPKWIPIQVWLVKGENGCNLIDAGLPFMGKGILQAADSLGLGPITKVLLTHGHPDHVGGLQYILKQQQLPVFATAAEIPYAAGEKPYIEGKKSKAALERRQLQPLVEQDGAFEQIEGLVPYLTPGHTPGHASFFHKEDGVLLAGDLFATKRGHLAPPVARFTTNMKQNVESGRVVVDLQPQLLSICHGKELQNPHLQYEAYAAAYSK